MPCMTTSGRKSKRNKQASGALSRSLALRILCGDETTKRRRRRDFHPAALVLCLFSCLLPFSLLICLPFFCRSKKPLPFLLCQAPFSVSPGRRMVFPKNHPSSPRSNKANSLTILCLASPVRGSFPAVFVFPVFSPFDKTSRFRITNPSFGFPVIFVSYPATSFSRTV